MASDGRGQQQLGLTAIDLFCGAGGLSVGFATAGFEITHALDRDPDSCATYGLNHPATKVDELSIEDITPAEFAHRVGDVDIVLGGPSCQGFSTHGRREQWADLRLQRNRLWRRMLGVIEAVRPRAFVLENVPGLAYAHDAKTRRKKVTGIIEEFERLGYVVHRDILLAADYGLPQLRRRVFLVGVLSPLQFVFPSPTHLGGWRRDTLELWEERRVERGLLRHITCWEAIGDLPPLGTSTGQAAQPYRAVASSEYGRLMRHWSRRLRDHECSSIWPKYKELVRYVPPGGTWRDIPRHLLPDRFRGMRRTDSTNLLGRLDPERPAYTITTQFNNVTAGCFTHPFEDRALSIREGARLQSFPDRYRFVGSLESRYRQIGNAVPPLLAQHLAVALATTIHADSRPKRPPIVKSVREAKSLRAPSDLTKRRMRGQSRKDTKPEVLLRGELSALKLRFRKNVRPLPDLRREVDVYFGPTKVAVFVDGCFWHGCPKHSRPTKSNTKWWADKIETNRQRDRQTTRRLQRAGIRVVRVWEHEDPAVAAQKIAKIVRDRRAAQ